MKIRKTYQGVVPNGKVLNNNSSSVTDTYSCDYINKFDKKVLYDNTNGSTEEIILNDSIENYSFCILEFIRYNNKISQLIRNGQNQLFSIVNLSPTQMQMETEVINVSGTKITRGTRYYGNIQGTNVSSGSAENSQYYITKVIGYK